MLGTRGHRRVGDMARRHVRDPQGARGHLPGPPALAPAAGPAPSTATRPPGYPPAPGYGPPTGYGPPAPGSGTRPRATTRPPAPASSGRRSDAPPAPGPAPPQPVTDPTTDGPHWDEVRDTYIQYDRSVEAWVEWNDKAKHWRPIDEPGDGSEHRQAER